MRRRWGLLLLALVALHVLVKVRAGQPWEVLWLCHVASALVAVGLLADLRGVFSAAFLFHLGIAVPTYLLHLATCGDTNWTSALLHGVTPLAGWRAWRGRPLAPEAPWAALALTVGATVLSRAFTPRDLNLNLAFAPWSVSASLGLWPNRAANLVLAGVLPWAAGRLWRRLGEAGRG